jgi:hypothetical protein|nr:MAG TPA: antitoxin [Caudoviricetes sp.]
MKIADETIIKFKNGETLRVPAEVYEKINFDKQSIVECGWNENGINSKIQFSLKDVLYIGRTAKSTSKEKSND